MRIYVHEPDLEMRVVEDVTVTASAVDLLTITETESVYLDDDVDPIDVAVSITSVLTSRGHESRHHHHLHKHPCRTVAVSINYGGDAKIVRVAPNTTISALLTKALTEYGIDASTGADLVLRVPGSNDDLAQSGFVSELRHTDCLVELNLLPAHREAG